MRIKLHFAISPCPNDTFMFGALAKGLVSNETFEPFFEFHDIEELNKGLLQQQWDVAKMSIAHYPLIEKHYQLLQYGMAMGFGAGPLIVANSNKIDLSSLKKPFLIPGEHTSANALLKVLFPQIQNKKEMLFSEIPKAISSGEYEAGIIIHESRFTYSHYHLYLIADTGKMWELRTGLPLPLGGIVVRRSLDSSLKTIVENSIKESIDFAKRSPDLIMDFVADHAAEMDKQVMQQHIELYVNHFSSNPSELAMKAIDVLLGKKR